MILPGHDNRSLGIAEGLDLLESLNVERDVDRLVAESRLVQGAVGGVALHAVGLGVDGDRHVGHFLALVRGRWAGIRVAANGTLTRRFHRRNNTRVVLGRAYRPAGQDTTPRGPGVPAPLDNVSDVALCTMRLLPVESGPSSCGRRETRTICSLRR